MSDQNTPWVPPHLRPAPPEKESEWIPPHLRDVPVAPAAAPDAPAAASSAPAADWVPPHLRDVPAAPAEPEEWDATATAKAAINKDDYGVAWDVITPDEIGRIAKATNVDPKWLASVAGWSRLIPAKSQEDANTFAPGEISDYLKQAASTVDALAGGSLISGSLKRALLTDNEHRAMDALRAFANEKRPMAATALDIGTSLASAVATGAPLLKGGLALAKGAGLTAAQTGLAGTAASALGGAAQSLASADKGSEVQDLVLDTMLTTLGFGLGAAGKRALGNLKKKATGSLLANLEAVAKDARVIEKAEDAFQAAKPAEDILNRVVVGSPDSTLNFTKFAQATSIEDAREIAKLATVGSAKDVAKIAEREAADPTAAAAKVLLGLNDPDAETLWKAYAVARQAAVGLKKAARIGNIKTKSIKDYVEREAADGGDFVARQFEDLRRNHYRTNELLQAVTPALEGEATDRLGKIGLGRRAWVALADARYVYDAMDNRFGTTLSPLIDRMSNNHNAYTVALGAATEAMRPALAAIKGAEKKTLDNRDFRAAAWDALNSGEFSPKVFTPAQIGALQSWKKVFSDFADRADNIHIDYEALDLPRMKITRKLAGPEQSYVPHQLKPTNEVVAELEYRWKAMDLDGQKNLVDRAHAWRNADDALKAQDVEGREAHELLLGHEILSDRSIKSAKDLATVQNNLAAGIHPGEATSTFAAALAKRGEKMPDWLMEKDLAKLAQGWAQSTYRHAFLRSGLSEMLRSAELVSQVSPILGDYIRNHVKDLTGIRRDAAAGKIQGAFTAMKLSAERQSRAATSPAAKEAWKMVANVDDMLKAASSNMYSYFLGARVDTAARNYIQPFAMTAPQLGGGAYAYKTTANAYQKLLGNTTGLADAMRKEGQLPSNQMFEAVNNLKLGLAETTPAGWTKAKLEAAANVSMSLYSAADKHNRIVTRQIASDVLADARAGSEPAMEALRRMPAGYRTQVISFLKSGNEKKAEKAYQDYLLGSTQFNYNKVSMSEFGRYMGWMFSMFTKWPTSFIGEMGGIADARLIGRPIRGDLQRIGWKYLAPMLVTQVAQNEWKEKREEVPAPLRKIVGEDVRKWSPSDTPIQMLREESPTQLPPVVAVVLKTGKALSGGDLNKAASELLDFGMSASPGGIIPRFLMEELPEWLDKERKSPSIGKRVFGSADE